MWKTPYHSLSSGFPKNLTTLLSLHLILSFSYKRSTLLIFCGNYFQSLTNFLLTPERTEQVQWIKLRGGQQGWLVYLLELQTPPRTRKTNNLHLNGKFHIESVLPFSTLDRCNLFWMILPHQTVSNQTKPSTFDRL